MPPDTSPLRTDPDGTIWVGTSRVPLERVIHAYLGGSDPAAIVQHYPTVALADVYGAIEYYLRFRAEVDAYVADRERQADELERQVEATFGSQEGLRQRMLGRAARP